MSPPIQKASFAQLLLVTARDAGCCPTAASLAS